MLALGFAMSFTLAVIDYLLVGRLSLFFDLSFITLCLFLAVRVEYESLYLGAVLPPVLLVSVVLLLGLVSPAMVAEPDDGVVQSLVTGIATHSVALVAGWALALLTLEGRRRGLLDLGSGD